MSSRLKISLKFASVQSPLILPVNESTQCSPDSSSVTSAAR